MIKSLSEKYFLCDENEKALFFLRDAFTQMNAAHFNPIYVYKTSNGFSAAYQSHLRHDKADATRAYLFSGAQKQFNRFINVTHFVSNQYLVRSTAS